MKLDEITHTARRDHLCAFCGMTVQKNERYVRAQSPGGAGQEGVSHRLLSRTSTRRRRIGKRIEGKMMDQMFLDDDELKSMTKRVQRAAQAKMLRSMGIAFKHRADGTLAVLRTHVEKEFGAGTDRQPKAKDFVPNWSGLNA